MRTNFVIGVSDYKISGCHYIIAGTDYRINRHFDVFCPCKNRIAKK